MDLCTHVLAKNSDLENEKGGAAGVSHDDPESPNVHFGGPQPSKTPPKFNEKTPRESTKSEILGGGRNKRGEILGGPAEGGPAEGGS